jgi:hypothetical protein
LLNSTLAAICRGFLRFRHQSEFPNRLSVLEPGLFIVLAPNHGKAGRILPTAPGKDKRKHRANGAM